MLDLLTAVGGAAWLTLVLALLLRWKKRTPKLTTLLMLAAGPGLAALLLGVASFFGATAGSVTGLGAAFVNIVTLILFFIVAHDLWPGHKADGKTPFAALLLPSFAAVGTIGFVATIVGGISGGLSDVTAALWGMAF